MTTNKKKHASRETERNPPGCVLRLAALLGLVFEFQHYVSEPHGAHFDDFLTHLFTPGLSLVNDAP
jgi:hypothetical protein